MKKRHRHKWKYVGSCQAGTVEYHRWICKECRQRKLECVTWSGRTFENVPHNRKWEDFEVP